MRRGIPVGWGVVLALVVGAVYFVPQGMYFWRTRAPEVLFEENYEETSFAVLTARAGQGGPEPYRFGGGAPRASSYSAQWLPPATLGAISRVLGVGVPAVFWGGSFLFPALIALLVAAVAGMCGATDRASLSLAVLLPLLALPPPYWLVLARYAGDALAGGTPEMLLPLPYSRRFQPQFSAVIHYLALAASVAALRLGPGGGARAAAAVAGVAFGASFYCYFFSWSLLVLWFVLGAGAVWVWHRDRLGLWVAAAGVGLAISIPYWMVALTHFEELGASGGTAYTHRVSPDLLKDLGVIAAVAAALALALWKTGWNRLLLWTPLALNLGALAAVLQNVVTGIHVPPWHYVHYFGRPSASLGLAALASAALANRPGVLRAVAVALVAPAVFFGAVVQWHRYRVFWPATERVHQAMPALKFLGQRAEPGAAVFAPQPEVHEAIPMYTAAAPFYSVYMWTWRNEGDAHRDALLERIAAAAALEGLSREEFARRVAARPWSIFYQYQQSALDPRREGQMREMERILAEQFDAILRGERPGAFAGLRYLLLPASTGLESTRAGDFFLCRKVWSDGRYAVFEVGARAGD